MLGEASLYAMQRIIKESEAGVLHATPAQVMGVLAHELGFFLKRVTRVVRGFLRVETMFWKAR